MQDILYLAHGSSIRVDSPLGHDFVPFRYGTGGRGFLVHVFVDQLELQPGGPADQFDGPFGIADSRQLDNDVLFPFPLDRRLRYAELVDPVADGFQRLLHRLVLYAFNLRLPHPQLQVEETALVKRSLDLEPGILVLEQRLHLVGSSLVEQDDRHPVAAKARNFLETEILAVQGVFQVGGDEVQLPFHRFLDLNLHDQVDPPLQVQSQV